MYIIKLNFAKMLIFVTFTLVISYLNKTQVNIHVKMNTFVFP